MIYPYCYAVRINDEEVRRESRSGGVFTAVSDYILKEGGAVYGCVLRGNRIAEHVRAESPGERDRMRGSKYIQSNTGRTFCEVLHDLEKGKKVLYTGTSCQIAGLRSFLHGRDCSRLICMDIVCHGVPSPLIWKEYLQLYERKIHGKCISVDFRNKKDFGWKEHIETMTFRTNLRGRPRTIHSNLFRKLFLRDVILRPACYHCPYKSVHHPGDLTIADYWGIEKAAPEFDDDKGVSLVLINNEKAEELFRAILPLLTVRMTRIEDSLQPALKAPFPEPADRQNFWNDYKSLSFEKVLTKYTNTTGCNYFINELRIFKRVVKSLRRKSSERVNRVVRNERKAPADFGHNSHL